MLKNQQDNILPDQVEIKKRWKQCTEEQYRRDASMAASFEEGLGEEDLQF